MYCQNGHSRIYIRLKIILEFWLAAEAASAWQRHGVRSSICGKRHTAVQGASCQQKLANDAKLLSAHKFRLNELSEANCDTLPSSAYMPYKLVCVRVRQRFEGGVSAQANVVLSNIHYR